MPSQYALKLPATKPDRIFSDAPPSRELVTISRTWRELVEVNTFTNSGISAPARVPQLMIVASFHHMELSPPRVGIMSELITKVRAMERREVSKTRVVSGVSKLNLARLPNRALAIAPLMKYPMAEEIT